MKLYEYIYPHTPNYITAFAVIILRVVKGGPIELQ